MKIIHLSQNKTTLVDDEDYSYLNQWKWCIMSAGYAARGVRINNKSSLILMHRIITNASKGLEVDHINMDRLDNRKDNLRICTHSENMQNTTKQKNNTSGYKGVYLDKRDGAWYSQILQRQEDGSRKTINSKRYKTPIEAAEAYDELVKKHYGVYGMLNFPIKRS